MDKRFKIVGAYLIIDLPAELDHHSAEQIRVQADKLIETHSIKTIVFDFADTTFMDSSGIGVIMGRYKNIHFIGGKVMAIRVNSRISKILKMSGLYKIIEVNRNIPSELESILFKGGTV